MCFQPEIETDENQQDIVLHIPNELREAFVTFLEVGLTSVTAHMEELENDELQLIELLKDFIDYLEHTEPTPEEILNHNRVLLRGDSVDIEGL